MTQPELTDPQLLTLAASACTPRQFEVVRHISEGRSIRTTARLLNISPSAVRDHLEAAQRRIKKAQAA